MSVAVVSEVRGLGRDAHQLVRVGDAELTLWLEYGDEEPRMADVDVAKRLAFKRPRDIRQIIERIWPEGQRPCVRVTVQRTQMPTGGTRETVVRAYWLTEAQILKVCARSETPIADAILDEMIAVYIAARRGLLVPVHASAPGLTEADVRRIADERVARALEAALVLVRGGSPVVPPASSARPTLTSPSAAGDARRFVEALNTGLRARSGHVVMLGPGYQQTAPADDERWGWTRRGGALAPCGPCVGYLAPRRAELVLDPPLALAVAGAHIEEPLLLSVETLPRALHAAGVLARTSLHLSVPRVVVKVRLSATIERWWPALSLDALT